MRAFGQAFQGIRQIREFKGLIVQDRLRLVQGHCAYHLLQHVMTADSDALKADILGHHTPQRQGRLRPAQHTDQAD